MSQLEGTKIAVAPVEHEECRRDGSVTPFPTMGKFESTLQDTTLDIGREWSEISEWPEWEEDGTLNKDNVSSFLSEHDFLLLLPSSVSQMIQPNGNDIEHTMETLKHHSRNDSFGHDDANISLDMIFPEQVENNSSLQYKTPQFGLSGNLAGIENIQEEAPTALALDMKPKPSKCGKQKDSEMLPQIKISDTFAEHPSSTDRDDNDQPAPPSVLPSLPTRPTTPGGPPFVCMHNTCRRSFNRLAELRRHQRGHVGNRSFFCRFIGCRRASHGFVRKDNLSQHLRRVHQVAA